MKADGEGFAISTSMSRVHNLGFGLRGAPRLDRLRSRPDSDPRHARRDPQNLPHSAFIGFDCAGHDGRRENCEGLQAIRWFKEGRLSEIAEYCCYDVKLTRLVHEYGMANRQAFLQK